MGTKKIRPVIKIYKGELAKSIKLTKVVLFGSFAKGTASEDSDIDLVVISPTFENMTVEKRFDILLHARKHPLTRRTSMDIFGVTPEEYKNASTLTTLGEVKETGIEV